MAIYNRPLFAHKLEWCVAVTTTSKKEPLSDRITR
jgi:hypothetical protein